VAQAPPFANLHFPMAVVAHGRVKHPSLPLSGLRLGNGLRAHHLAPALGLSDLGSPNLKFGLGNGGNMRRYLPRA
jgi:hypothetical protein